MTTTMKRFTTALIAALIIGGCGAEKVQAQRKGEFSLGARMTQYFRAKTFALGIYGNYGITRWLDIEPGINFLCKDNSSVDIYCDLHLRLEVAETCYIYPIAGIGLSDMSSESLGFDGWSFSGALGAGFNYRLNRRLTTSIQCKWIAQTAHRHRNPVSLSLGIEYAF